MKRKKVLRRGWASATISYAYLSILAVVAGFPLVWILLSSVKSKGELAGDPTKFFPSEITFDHFKAVFQQLHFGNNVLNSILIAGTTTLSGDCNICTRGIWYRTIFPPALARC